MISIDAKEIAVVDGKGNLIMSMNSETTVVQKGYQVMYGTDEEALKYNESRINTYEITTTLLGNKRVDEVVSEFDIYELAQVIEKAQEENEFVLFETTAGTEIAVRASDIVTIVRADK